jgi:hypothetical protein
MVSALSKNYVLVSSFLAWLIAQTVKVGLGVIKEKRFNFKWFVGTGGMPSSHTAGVVALATSVGLHLGLNSPLFALAVVFAIVTMFDAQGVRRATGRQAEILNRIVDDLYWKGKIRENRLRELIGHTPVEVLAGAAIGILVAFLLYS